MLSSTLVYGERSKLAPDVKRNGNGPVDVIVQFTGPPTEAALASVIGGGGVLKQKFGTVNAVLVSVPATAIQGLEHNPNVRYVTPDRGVGAHLEFAGPTVNANIAFNAGVTGRNITVAVIDSGVYSDHDDLKDRLDSENFVAAESTKDDLYGHGTHVAGIIAGNASMSSGSNYSRRFRGIAPDAHIMSLRALDSHGQGLDSAVIAAIDRAITLKQQYGAPQIINLSLGRPVMESYTLDPLCQAVEAAWKAGITVVAAAGNDGRNNSMGTNGYATITSPGNDPYVITVGAMKDMGTVSRGDDLMASYSSKGPTAIDHIVKPDILAPGNRLASLLSPRSTLAALYPANVIPFKYYQISGDMPSNAQYMWMSGTSAAAPVVSGAVALMLQKNPTLTPDIIKARLMKTATKAFPSSSIVTDPQTGISYVTQYDLFTVGAGYLDVWAALNNTDSAVGRALSPAVAYDPVTGVVSLQSMASGSNVVWGDNIIWGSNIVWGTNVVWGSNVLSAAGSVVAGSNIWGSTATQGFNVIWGDNIVWGASNPFSEPLSITGEE